MAYNPYYPTTTPANSNPQAALSGPPSHAPAAGAGPQPHHTGGYPPYGAPGMSYPAPTGPQGMTGYAGNTARGANETGAPGAQYAQHAAQYAQYYQQYQQYQQQYQQYYQQYYGQYNSYASQPQYPNCPQQPAFQPPPAASSVPGTGINQQPAPGAAAPVAPPAPGVAPTQPYPAYSGYPGYSGYPPQPSFPPGQPPWQPSPYPPTHGAPITNAGTAGTTGAPSGSDVASSSQKPGATPSEWPASLQQYIMRCFKSAMAAGASAPSASPLQIPVGGDTEQTRVNYTQTILMRRVQGALKRGILNDIAWQSEPVFTHRTIEDELRRRASPHMSTEELAALKAKLEQEFIEKPFVMLNGTISQAGVSQQQDGPATNVGQQQTVSNAARSDSAVSSGGSEPMAMYRHGAVDVQSNSTSGPGAPRRARWIPSSEEPQRSSKEDSGDFIGKKRANSLSNGDEGARADRYESLLRSRATRFSFDEPHSLPTLSRSSSSQSVPEPIALDDATGDGEDDGAFGRDKDGWEDGSSKIAIKGTSQSLEKQYLRITTPPTPDTVRPPSVLKAAFKMLQERWKREGKLSYKYLCGQLKSIRQDLTLQRIRSIFAVRVYEYHARVALIVGDLSEFNQCQTQLAHVYAAYHRGVYFRPFLYSGVKQTYTFNPLRGTYESSPDSDTEKKDLRTLTEDDEGSVVAHELEFACYRVLYSVIAANSQATASLLRTLMMQKTLWEEKEMKHCLAIREAITTQNYVKFFRLRKQEEEAATWDDNVSNEVYSSRQAFYLIRFMTRALEGYVRQTGLQTLLVATRPRPLALDSHLADLFGFGSVNELREFLSIRGCEIEENGEFAKTTQTVLVAPPVSEDTVKQDLDRGITHSSFGLAWW